MTIGEVPNYQENYSQIAPGVGGFSYFVYGNGNLYVGSSWKIGGIYKASIEDSKISVTLLSDLGDPVNNHVQCLVYYNGYLYASKWNDNSKTIIYKIDVKTGSYSSFIKIEDSSRSAYSAKGFKIYNNYLYVTVYYDYYIYQGIYKFNMNDDNTNIKLNNNNLFISNTVYNLNKINNGYIEIDNNGNLYLTNQCIVKFDKTGSLINPNFSTVKAIVIILYKNNLFCTTFNTNSIEQLNLDGVSITNNFGSAFGGDANNNAGGGIAFDEDGNLYLSQPGYPVISRILARYLPPWPTPAPPTSVPLLISEDYTFITSLRVPASKGDTKIYVKDDSKFKIGDTIQIGSSDITIAKVIAFGSLVLDTPLKFNYSGNVPVGIMKDQTKPIDYTIYIIIAVIVVIIICSSSLLIMNKNK